MLPSNRDPSLSLPRRSLRQSSAPNFLPERTLFINPDGRQRQHVVLVNHSATAGGGRKWVGGQSHCLFLPSALTLKRPSEPTSCILFCSTVMQPFHASTSTHSFIMHFSIVNYAWRPGCVLAPRASWGGVLSARSGIMERLRVILKKYESKF